VTINATLFRSLWKMMPDRRTVTFRRKITTTPAYTNYTVADAWYRPDETAEGQTSQGVYIKRYRRWYLVKEKMTAAGFTADPLPDDLIVNTASTIDPTAGTWNVIGQREVGALGAWELPCIMMQIRSAFAVTVSVQRRTGAKDDTARLMPTTTTVATPSGWFQIEGSEAMPNLLEKTQMPTKGTIYFATYVSGLLATDTLAVSGTSYNIVTMVDPQNDQELQSCTVELAR
jgi:hypothetical protein